MIALLTIHLPANALTGLVKRVDKLNAGAANYPSVNRLTVTFSGKAVLT